MSNNTKRLSFFAKIAQRSTALQSLLEVATGKSAVGAIAPDRQGQIGVREKHTYYTTERYQKDIEVAQAQPTPPVVVEPAGIQIALYSGSEPLGVTMNYAAISVPGETEKSTWAYGDATSQGIAGTNSSNPAVGDTVYFKSAGSSEWTETIMSSYTARVSNASLGPCISANVELEGVIQGYCVLTNPEASQAHSGCYKWTHGLGEFELYTSSAEPSANDKIYCNGSEVGTVIAYSNITSDAVSPSNDPSAESINPNLEARIKHVKEFYRGESVYFMKEVGIKRYPNHYHVAWTVPSAADGTLSATANGFPLFNGEAAIEGATIVFTATPASGKQVDQWSGLPQGATTAGNTATFTLAADVNASVTFAEAAAVTSIMEYYYDEGGEQSIFVRDSDADKTKDGAPMYAWYSESQNDYRYTNTASPVADMNCVNYDGTELWWRSSGGEWQNYSAVLPGADPNTRSIIASIDPHMYQNIKVCDIEWSTEPVEYVVSRNPESDGYDTEDGKVLIAWHNDEYTFYTKSLDIEVSSEQGEFDSTNLWLYVEETGKYVNITAQGEMQYVEILAVDVVAALRFESEEENATITLSNNGSGAPTGVQYTTNGIDWTDYTIGTTGAIAMPCEFKAASWALTPATGEVKFSASEGASVVLSGHITSLCGRYGTTNNTLTEGTSFPYLFYQLPVTDASNLILATNTTDGCYENMFYGCTSLTYWSDLPVLSATSLSPECYYGMFHDCTSLEEAPILPATTLASNCYAYMFQGCTSLANPPALPAEILVEQCYAMMFYDCSSLNEVHCAATDISATECTDYWLGNVAASGNFYGKTAAGWTEGSPSGIPSGWTFHEE